MLVWDGEAVTQYYSLLTYIAPLINHRSESIPHTGIHVDHAYYESTYRLTYVPPGATS